MKGTKQNRDVVVPLRDTRVMEQRSSLYPLASEIGDLRLLTDKLLYRIQQCERREKELLHANRSLRRELTALKKQLHKPATRRASRPAAEPSVEPPRHDPPSYERPSEPPPDFGAALGDLNSGRH